MARDTFSSNRKTYLSWEVQQFRLLHSVAVCPWAFSNVSEKDLGKVLND